MSIGAGPNAAGGLWMGPSALTPIEIGNGEQAFALTPPCATDGGGGGGSDSCECDGSGASAGGVRPGGGGGRDFWSQTVYNPVVKGMGGGGSFSAGGGG